MDKEVFEVPVVSEAIRRQGVPLSPVVRGGGFVFVSGLPPVDPETGKLFGGDIGRQTELSLENVKRALEAAGSSLEKVVKATIYITNAAHFETVNAVYRRYFPHQPPARSFIAMSSWPVAFDIEIECIALA